MKPKKKKDRSGIERIADERARQIAKEGWDDVHDDEHDDHELVWAAICFAAPQPVFVQHQTVGRVHFSDPWPGQWDEEWDKRVYRTNEHDERVALVYGAKLPRKRYLRQLEKAGALLAAEIDRLLREKARDA